MPNTNKPHIVKFSGGRSSGMMLLKLLENNKLDPGRGDVIVFNNTSAEHSATYEFTRKMKKLTEDKYNIPFFWIEYQTYEDLGRNYRWSRKPAYRLVNDLPYNEDNKDGYRYKGEVFEEMISYNNGFLPTRMRRTCTLSMKIFITNSFLSDWFAQKEYIERLGHYGKNPRTRDIDITNTHRENGGGVPDGILLSKKEYLAKCDFVREKQYWKDWTKASIAIDNEELRESTLGGKSQLYGDLAVDYVSCLGIRGDERGELLKFKDRIENAQENNGKSLFNQPHGESILAPLADDDVTQQQVIDFWKEQSFDLELSGVGLFSNCVYCPLKGKAKLLKIAKEELKNKPTELTPENIDWWIAIEKKYSRNLIAENRKITSENPPKFIGFFGATKKMVFEEIKKQAQNGVTVSQEMPEMESHLPCYCTD
ncbi:MAG: hypothetical protein R1F54_04165 [Candidatus Zeuxoniibacter abyssi]|nr:MAG: hypothetical protein R1F54_04165 [Candidatus Persebacteraceae bacterium AB1(2)]